MSIASTVATLERANATHKAAQAAATPVARRGMFALVERRHSYTSLLHGAYAGYIGYTPCIVTSVDRSGIVKEVRIVAIGYDRLTRRDWQEITVDSRQQIRDPESVVASLIDEHGRAVEYKDKAEAVVAIKNAAGLAS
jgi:hypothetical protein